MFIVCVILVWLADVLRMIVSTSPYGVNGLNSGRVIEVVQYVDCRSIDKVEVESWCKVVLRSLVQRNVFRAA